MTTERTSEKSVAAQANAKRVTPALTISALEWRLWLITTLAGAYALVWLALMPETAATPPAARTRNADDTLPAAQPRTVDDTLPAAQTPATQSRADSNAASAVAPAARPRRRRAASAAPPAAQSRTGPTERTVVWLADLPLDQRPVVVLPDGWTLTPRANLNPRALLDTRIASAPIAPRIASAPLAPRIASAPLVSRAPRVVEVRRPRARVRTRSS